ncbi:MAG: TPM domain-containing protein [bacterium]
MKKIRLFTIFFFILLLFGIIFSNTFADQSIPEIIGRINDFADMLTSYEEIQLESLLEEYEKTTSNQIVVVTIDTLRGNVLENYSMRLAEKWKIGQKGKNNGVILLIVKQEKKLRIEVGYGLEGALPDGLCGSIIREKIAPFFKGGYYLQGIKNGLNAIIKATKDEYISQKTINDITDTFITWLIILSILSGFFVLWMAAGIFKSLHFIFISLFKNKEKKPKFLLFPNVILPVIGAVIHFITFKILMINPIKDTFVLTMIFYTGSLFLGGIIFIAHYTIEDFWSISFSDFSSGSGGYGGGSYNGGGSFGGSGGSFGGSGGSFGGGGGSFGGGGASGGW